MSMTSVVTLDKTIKKESDNKSSPQGHQPRIDDSQLACLAYGFQLSMSGINPVITIFVTTWDNSAASLVSPLMFPQLFTWPTSVPRS